jgi:hypothetical protein
MQLRLYILDTLLTMQYIHVMLLLAAAAAAAAESCACT